MHWKWAEGLTMVRSWTFEADRNLAAWDRSTGYNTIMRRYFLLWCSCIAHTHHVMCSNSNVYHALLVCSSRPWRRICVLRFRLQNWKMPARSLVVSDAMIELAGFTVTTETSYKQMIAFHIFGIGEFRFKGTTTRTDILSKSRVCSFQRYTM